jgi:hypothetical protein
VLDNLIHLTLLAIAAGLLPNYGPQYGRYELLSAELLKAYQNFASSPGQSRTLMIWSLFVGGVTVLGEDMHPWLLPLVAQTCGELELRSWSEARLVVGEYAWLRAVHDNKGRGLWEAVESYNKETPY